MLDTIFSSATTATELSVLPLLACTLACLVYGGILALVYGWRTRHSASFMMALCVLPAIVCIVIALVNGNVGAGVAVAGTFSLVRFRSAPGSVGNVGVMALPVWHEEAVLDPELLPLSYADSIPSASSRLASIALRAVSLSSASLSGVGGRDGFLSFESSAILSSEK